MSIDTLIPDDRPRGVDEEQPTATALVGYFTADVNNVDDLATVIVPGFSTVHAFDDARWMPRVNNAGATVLPSKDDSALIVLDQDEDPWVIAWWPS